jgi:hypothetical protein
MYGLIFGQNPASDFLLGILNLTKEDVGRFRDCFVTEDGSQIAVYTRNGGGNREHWSDDKEAGESCHCPGCTIEYHLPKHPLYVRDEDDDFDRTYATVYFRVPDEAKALVKDLAEKRDPNALWLKTLDDLKQGKRPDIVEKMRPMMEALLKAIGELS